MPRRGYNESLKDGMSEEMQGSFELERQRQEELSDGLLDSVKELKERQKMMGLTLDKDDKVVDDIDGQLAKNLNRVQATNVTLKKEVDSYNRTSMIMFLLLFVVSFMFFGIFVFMRLFPKPKGA